MRFNPRLRMPELGQNVWLDYLRKDVVESVELQRLLKNDGLRGLTSKPAIFWKTIDGSGDYTSSIRASSDQRKNSEQVYRTPTLEDVQKTADIFRPVFDQIDGDLEALREHERRVVRIALGNDAADGLGRIRKITAKPVQCRSR